MLCLMSERIHLTEVKLFLCFLLVLLTFPLGPLQVSRPHKVVPSTLQLKSAAVSHK